MAVLFTIFGISILGIFAIVARHIPAMLKLQEEEMHKINGSNGTPKSSLVVSAFFVNVENYIKLKAIPAILKALERSAFLIEKGASLMSKKALQVRLFINGRIHRSRVIPRESLYWREIHLWKNTGTKVKKSSPDKPEPNEEHDISHHDLE